MPISSTSAFNDSGDFQAALRRCGIVRLIPAQVGGFRARLTDIRLSQLELMSGRESVSRSATVSPPVKHVLLVFPKTTEGAHYWAERRLGLGELAVISGAVYTTWRICAPTGWGAVLLSMQMLFDCLHTLGGQRARLPPPGLSLWRPRWPAFDQLLQLHRAVVRHTARQPEALVEAAAAHGLEQELLAALVDSLTDMSAKCN